MVLKKDESKGANGNRDTYYRNRRQKAAIDEDVVIGPFSIIGSGATIRKGQNNVHVVIEGNTEIGEGCTVYPFTSIGLPLRI